ncbi:MAG: cache domain-containing protein [Halanaerobiales bacterium]
MINLTIKKKIILLFLLVSLVPVIVVGYFAYRSSQNEIKNSQYRTLNMYAEIVDNKLSDYFEEREGDAHIFAANSDVYESLDILQENDWELSSSAWEERLERLEILVPTIVEEYGYSFAFLTDPEGRLVYTTTDEVEVGTDLSGRDYVQRAMEGDTNWSDVFFSDVIDRNCMVISVPVKDEGTRGEVIGTANLLMGQEGIDSAVHEGIEELGETADAYLIDEEGLLITNTMIGQYSDGAALEERIDTRAVELLSGPLSREDKGFSAAEEYSEYRGVPVLGRLTVTSLGDDVAGLVIEIDQAEIFAGLNTIRNLIIYIVAAAAIISVLISYFSVNSILKSLDKFRDLFADLALGDLSVSFPIKQVNCSEIMDCGVEDCPDFERDGVTCWFDVGSYAPEFNKEIYCPKIKNGEYDSCKECKVYKKVNNDEIQVLGAWFNKLVDNLRELVGSVMDISSNLSAASQELSASGDEVAASAEEVGNAIQQVASGAEEQSGGRDQSHYG